MNKLEELKKVIDDGYDWYFKNTDGYCKASEGWIEIRKIEDTYYARRDNERDVEPYSILIYSYVFCEEGRRVEFEGKSEDEVIQKAIDYFKGVIKSYINSEECQETSKKQNHSQRKKVEDDGSNVTQLDTRSRTKEADKTEQRIVSVDNHADILKEKGEKE